MSFPNVDEVRKHIEAVTDKEMRYCLETCFLYAGRISEVVGKVYPSDKDKTSARGPRGKDVLGPIENLLFMLCDT